MTVTKIAGIASAATCETPARIGMVGVAITRDAEEEERRQEDLCESWDRTQPPTTGDAER